MLKILENTTKPKGKNINKPVILLPTQDMLTYLIWILILNKYTHKYRFLLQN